jgi:superfamily II DNA or RNA helicase
MREEVPGLRVLIVVPTVALLDQWVVELATFLQLTRPEVATHGGGNRGIDSKASIHIAVVNTARTLTASLTASGPWMLIADECHRYGAPANRSAIRSTWVASLGLSATPTREYDDWFSEYVAPQTGEIFFEYSYEDALQDNVLTPFTVTNYRVPLTGRENQAIQQVDRDIARLLSSNADIDDDRLKRALMKRARMYQSAKARLPAARALMAVRHGIRSIIFHESIDAANSLVELLRRDEHRVIAYHSALSSPTRQKNLLMFRTHQVDIIVTCRALDEGFDVPDAQFGLICASTASARQRIQRLGRLVRKAEGKAEAEVATIYASDAEASKLTAEEDRLSGLARVTWFSVKFE